MVNYTSKVEYFPHGVSYHSLIALWLIAQPPTSLPRAQWKINAFWLQLFTSQESIVTQIVVMYCNARCGIYICTSVMEMYVHWKLFRIQQNFF